MVRMIREVVGFELRFQLRSPAVWSTFALFFLLAFGSITLDGVSVGGGGNTWVNSPYAIAQTLSLLTLFAMFVVVGLVAGSVIRDDETGFGAILRATPVTRFAYLYGRFAGAWIASLLVYASVPLGMALGSLMPWVDPETLGPLRLDHYAYLFATLAAPTLLVMAAALFALATATRSMLSSYLGVIAFFIGYSAALASFAEPGRETLIALVEPLGIGALAAETRFWTPAERNTQLLPLSGLLLWNRLIWIGLSIGFLALAGALYQPERVSKSTRRWFGRRSPEVRADRDTAKGADATSAASPGPGAAAVLPVAKAQSGTRATWAQAWARTRFEMRLLVRSPGFIILLLFGMVNAGFSLWFADELYGTSIFPVTRVMIETLQTSFAVIPMIVALYYAGDLVWRDRERRIHEIIDATPAPDWTFVVPKMLGISLVLLAANTAGVGAAVGVQALRGWTDFELTRYASWFLAPSTLSAVQLAVLAVFVQALSPQKFIGWGLMLVYFVGSLVLSQIGFEHGLYQFGYATGVPLSDMNGVGHFWVGNLAFNLYWTAFSLLLMVVVFVLWPRGGVSGLATRWRRVPQRLRGGAGALAGGSVVIWLVSGGWVFYNTNVLNDFETTDEVEALLADYETEILLPFDSLPQPRIVDVTLAVDLDLAARRVDTQGSYKLENRSVHEIKQIHVAWPSSSLDMVSLEIDGAREGRDWPDFNYRIFELDQPMRPGEQRELRFATVRQQRGFANQGNDTRVVANGTFLDNSEIAPSLGPSRNAVLQDRSTRRKYGLEPERRMPKLEDESARATHFLRRDSDWVHADITVSTAADQIPIAPGYLVSDETVDGRRVRRFRSDAPIQNFFSIQSARYEVARDRHEDVDLEVYFDPAHDENVGRMIEAMKLSLAVFEEAFSPFQFRQARILEFPAYSTFAQSFANTIPYSEGIGFIMRHDDDDTESIDMVTYVTAHELAHQWWGHQVVGAALQGSQMLSETFSQYGALLVMERLYGPDQVRRFLRFELDAYLGGRATERIEELPLNRVEIQQYIYYNKGALVMYLLRHEIGEAAVNRALQRLLEQFAFQPAPYPTTTNFIAMLREEAGPEHDALITDLLERITLYDLKVTSATSTLRDDGRFDVEVQIEALKLIADGQGEETEEALDQAIEIGLFTAEPGSDEFGSASVVQLEKHRVVSGPQTLRFTVDREPGFAGVDPYNRWIDRAPADNVRRVESVK